MPGIVLHEKKHYRYLKKIFSILTNMGIHFYINWVLKPSCKKLVKVFLFKMAVLDMHFSSKAIMAEEAVICKKMHSTDSIKGHGLYASTSNTR